MRDKAATIEQFDYRDPGQRSPEGLAKLRATCPVAHGDSFGGYYALTTHSDIVQAARDVDCFSSASGVTIPDYGRKVRLKPQQADPPQHGQYRKILLPFFTSDQLDRLTPTLRGIVSELVSSFASRGHADLVQELAVPVPMLVVSLMLGIDAEHWQQLSDWNEIMHATTYNGDTEGNQAASAAVRTFLGAQVHDRAVSPRQDMLTAIAKATIDGRQLTEEEQVALVQMIVVAGDDTMRNGIASVLAHLAAHPSLRHEVADDPSKIEVVAQECFRLVPPVFGLARTVRHDVTLGGIDLCAGDRVLMVFASGNRDETVFVEPDVFDPARPHNRDLTFGYGRHRCLGESLAKLEIQIVVEEMLRQVPDFTLATELPLPMRNDLLCGPLQVPVVWDVAGTGTPAGHGQHRRLPA